MLEDPAPNEGEVGKEMVYPVFWFLTETFQVQLRLSIRQSVFCHRVSKQDTSHNQRFHLDHIPMAFINFELKYRFNS